ncbi:hypothetical protein A7U60_g6959 [Sanghuangporus baumii]|uniref:Bromodomain associated domain-containing protein n=1 Tax=Sanghuangporus baumii TaxID=108892 RepID=A0A9Q5HU95_SANBA|nr:hypothetical protein A7U60_g6959 [Sanghuangporus baumii]
MDGAASALLESITQKTLHAHSFNRASTQATHVLTELLTRYVSLLTSTCARYAEHAGRSSVSIPDAVLALDELGVSVEELVDYVQGEGRELLSYEYARMTARRAEELALLKESSNEGRRMDYDDAMMLVYAELPEADMNGFSANEEDLDSEIDEEEEHYAKRKVNGDAARQNGSDKGDGRMASPTLPPSPISNPSSPSRKRPRLSTWDPPSHVPDFLPPYPMAAKGDTSLPSSPQLKLEAETMLPPPSTGPERERVSAPLPQQLSTAASAADYLTPVPYNMSSLSSVPETHLPDQNAFKKLLSGSGHALQLQPRKHPTPDVTPALLGAYHHLLTNPPPPHPSMNPARHRVALAMLFQAYTTPRWSAPDTLFGIATAPKPRVVAPGPSFPVPIGSKGKDEQPLPMPSSSSRPIVVNEAVVLPSFQPRSRIPDIAGTVLPGPCFSRATRVVPPPPLVNNTTKDKFLYGVGIPAVWNSSSGPQAPSTQPRKAKVEDDEDERHRDQKDKDSSMSLPDAVLHATWDWETHDYRQPIPHHKRTRAMSTFGVNSVGNSGADGVNQHSAPLRKNSIKIAIRVLPNDAPISLNAYTCSNSSGSRLLESIHKQQPSTSRPYESDLLKSVRAALQGSGKEPCPSFRKTTSSAIDGQDGEEDLTWDDSTVVYSTGGTLRQSWNFEEEGQRIQYVCFGWLLIEGTVHPSNHGGGAHHEDDVLPFAAYIEQKSERDPFGPFFRARKAGMRTVEPTMIARGIYVFLRSFGKVFLMNGLEYSFSLPFIVHRAWPLSPHGVLLERVIEPPELDEPDPLPRLYSMTNPFQEPRPVGLTENIKGGHGFSLTPAEIAAHELEGVARTIHAEEQVVWIAPRVQDTSDSDNIITTLDRTKRRLSFWRYIYIPPNAVPVASPTTTQDKQGSLPGDKARTYTKVTGHSGKDMIARSDRIRAPSPELDLSQPPELGEMPPLSALPGMAPTLSSTMTLASLASSGSTMSHWPSSAPIRGRRNSLTRNDLTSTMDRMILGRRSEVQNQPTSPVVNQSISPVYWAERLYEYQLSEEDSIAWQNLSFATYDQRFDGKQPRSLVAFCLPASQFLVVLNLATASDENTLKMTFSSTRLRIQSIVPVKSTRPHTWDLLILKSDGNLSLLGFDNMEIPLKINISGLGYAEAMAIDSDDVSMSDEHSGSSATSSGSPKVIGVSDPLVSTVKLILDDGRLARLALDLTPTDQLVFHIIQVLTVYCKSDDYFRIYKSFIHSWMEKRKSASPDVQFDCLAEAILKNWGVGWVSTEDPSSSAAPTDAWSELLSTSTHFHLRDDTALATIMPVSPPPPRLPTIRDLSRSDKVSLHCVLMGLHVLGEEYRLLIHKHEPLLRLSTLTLRLAQLIRPGFSDLLKRLYPTSSSGWTTGIDMTPKGEVMLPLDVSSALYARLAQPEHKSTLLENTANRTNLSHAFGRIDPHPILREFTQLFTVYSDIKQNDGRKRAEATVLMMAQRQFGFDYLNLLPLAFSAPLREAARTCQLGPPPDWPIHAYEFVGRTDLTESGKINGDLMFNDGYRSMKDHLKKGVPRKSYRLLFEEVHRAVDHSEESATGVELEITDFTDVRFGQDRRIQEVARMLRSSNIPSIRMIDRPDLNEHDFAKEQQMQVLRTAERTLALPIGRAMFTYSTVPVVTKEVYVVPKIELAIRLQPQNIVIAPEPGKLPLDATNWAEFHNGVAAALRISPATGSVDSSWISFNRPTELTPQHAGFLFGLGLNGHLKEMLTWQSFGYLTPKHELTSIGVLLGLAAAYIGTGNKHVTKLLAVHTPAFLPTPDVDLNVPLTTQAAGLVGMGLLHMATKNRRLAEVALHQISRHDLLLPDITNEYREAYTVAAGVSFGMIMLGRGTTTASPADVALLSRLRVLIHGEGPAVFHTKSVKQSFDINLTSPAATIALGLMYLRTDRQAVADILTIPDTVAALNHIQPNFLLVRTIARNMIMWSDIKPTREWLLKQVPQPIMRIMETRLPYQTVDDAIELAYYHITAGAVFSLALKYAGTANREAYAMIAEFYEFFRRTSWHSSPSFDHRIKRAASRDGLNLVTLSMGMVMVGSGELSCLKRLRLAHGMYNQPIRYGSHMATHMALGLLFLGEGRFSLGNSDAAVACMIAAFYPHFPALSSDNRAYLPALRHLWVLAIEPRCLIARDVDTKEVVYLPMKVKVKDENGTSITQLIAPTLIPSLDRLISIKIDTPRYWPFLLDIANNTRHMGGLLQSQTIFVKRRTMFLSYMEDPKGSRSLFVRSGMSTADAATLDFPRLTDTSAHPASDVHHYITSHSNDISFISFADRLCREDGITDNEKIFNKFCHAALLDCIIQDKPQMLSSYLALYRARVINPPSRYFQLIQQDLLRTDDFYSKLFERRFSGRAEGITRPALLRENSVSGALAAIDKKLEESIQENRLKFRHALAVYCQNQSNNEALRNSSEYPTAEQDLAWYLQRHAVPYAPYFPVLQQLSRETYDKYAEEEDIADGSDEACLLDKGINLVYHASVTGLVRPFGSWTVESFREIIGEDMTH